MTRKVVDIAAIIMFVSFFFLGSSYGQAPHEAKSDDREMAPHKGRAATVLNVKAYTYIEIEGKKGSTWIAGPTMEVEVGDKVWASQGIEMRDFYSKALDRTFPVIHFVGRAEAEGKDTKKITKTAGPIKKEADKPKTGVTPKKGSIAKAKGGYTLEEIFDKKKSLGGKKVVVRGKVVKAAAGKIMGKRWFHLQDGTGSKAALDLVFTSSGDANVGDTVLLTGILGLGKDFGQGYKYDVILEGAKIMVE